MWQRRFDDYKAASSTFSQAEIRLLPLVASISASLDKKPLPCYEVVTFMNWGNGANWRRSAGNTTWCLIGCSIGEFGTLAAYSIVDLESSVTIGSTLYWLLLVLPLVNGLITSIILETLILLRGQMDFSNALKTALGMSFISMLMMEVAMEITDLWFTKGELGMNPWAIPFMLIVGFLTPWPFNYWRLEKTGKCCHGG